MKAGALGGLAMLVRAGETCAVTKWPLPGQSRTTPTCPYHAIHRRAALAARERNVQERAGDESLTP